MLRNYFKIAWKNLERNKLYSFINIVGLGVGLAVCMLIMLYVGHESSYDKFHTNAARIVWIQGKIKMGGDSISIPKMSYATAPLTQGKAPFVESFIRSFQDFRQPVIQNIQSPELRFSEKNFLFADSNFFDFFSFPLLAGNKDHLLQDPFTLVISAQIAKKYFGNADPIGKTVRYNGDYVFTVTGVADKAPSNSSIQYDFIASLSSLKAIKELKYLTESQIVQAGSLSTYFLLHQTGDIHQLDNIINTLNKTTSTNGTSEWYIATPLASTHLNANYADASNIKYLKIFPFIAGFVLLLALINYVSLATARSAIRAKEIGVRKTMGAGRGSIAAQFFVESAMFTAISFILGYLLCVLFQPLFFNFLQIDIDHSFLHNPAMIIRFTLLFIITVVLASAYPSVLLSAYKPVAVLYGKFSRQSAGISMRKFFTVFQFSVSILLIICGIVIDRQMYFFRHADTGVNRERVVMIPFSRSIGKHYQAFKSEVGSMPVAQQTAACHYPMYKGYDMFFTKSKKSTADVSLADIIVDNNFISLLGLQWKIKPADSFYYRDSKAVILNESAVSKLNLGSNPLNETLPMGNTNLHVAGVLKDFNYQSMQGKIGALCLQFTSEQDSLSAWNRLGGCLFVKLEPGVNTQQAIKQLQSVYEKYDSAQPFNFYFMNDAFEAMYKAEDRLAKIFSAFTVFTLLIACMGLFGLSTFMALQRTKEIGIRKVLGASVNQVTVLLSKDFLKLVLIAIVIASPLAWLAMNKWLQTFAYRINISWEFFCAAAIFAILIALVTVSFQAIRAAIANPVNSLRSE